MTMIPIASKAAMELPRLTNFIATELTQRGKSPTRLLVLSLRFLLSKVLGQLNLY